MRRSTPQKRAFAKKMARNMTWPEKKLWSILRDRKQGAPFYPQRVIHGYIPDFWCPSCKIVVEADGKHHEARKQADYDARRDGHLAAHGILTLRFTASEIFTNLPAVAAVIRASVSKRL